MSFNQSNRDFWKQRATQWGDDANGSWQDDYMRELEMEALWQLLPCREGSLAVLDVGAGPGHMVDELNGDPQVRCTGIERELIWTLDHKQVYQHEALPFLQVCEDNTYDLAYCVRVLINMPHSEQRAVLKEMCRVAKRVVCIEEVAGGRKRLNGVRTALGLPPLQAQEFNKPCKQSLFKGFETESLGDLYYLLTRAARDLIDDPSTIGYNGRYHLQASALDESYRLMTPISPIRVFWKDTP